ncbi:CPBP family intramembrane glutamic endopeptidase [Salininema proteolyticum]|uniref:CPBP family intramembrane glutamic endopeptidase n=1 Tax=Salininema proteolyticum TaxID=1607685 RepID=A0ABV8TVS7_9ACTN
MSPAPSPASKGPWLLLGSFALLAFLFSGALAAVQPATGIDSEALTLPQFGPALAALTTWLIWRGRVAALLPAAVSRKQVIAHTVLMVAAVALFAAIATAFALATGQGMEGVAAVAGTPFVAFLALQLIGATGEEIGWRGFMQPLLETRMGRFAAASATGVVWAAWHIDIFTAGLAVASAFFVSTVAFAVLLGYMGNGSFWQRVATASIGHWLINIALHIVAGERVNESPQVYFTALAAVVTTAVFLAMFVRARAARQRARERDTGESSAD